MQQTNVIQTHRSLDELKDALLMRDKSIDVRNVKDPIFWQLSKPDHGVITAYSSGKIVIQASDGKWMSDVTEVISSKEFDSNGESFTPHIGVDETGKGDFFGPLVVAAVFVPGEEEGDKLRSLGVRDSKTVSNGEAGDLSAEIKKVCSYSSEIVISPSEYNEKNKSVRNANKILAEGHARAIETVLESIPKGDCPLVIIDQFSKDKSRVLDALQENGRKLEVQQMHRGERDIAVAAASIVARGRFLNEMEMMGKKFGVTFPKGASDVIDFGKDFVKTHGTSLLHEVAKTSFKTALQITSTFDL